jgi:hypothetical protein
MTQAFAETAHGWGLLVMQHVIETGHTNLVSEDDPREATRALGIACKEPGCERIFYLLLSAFERDTSLAARQLRPYLNSAWNKRHVVQSMINAAMATRNAPEPRRPTAWERLLVDDPLV